MNLSKVGTFLALFGLVLFSPYSLLAEEALPPVTELFINTPTTVSIDYANVQDNNGGSGFSQIKLHVKKNSGSWVDVGVSRSSSSGSLSYLVTGSDATFSLSAEVLDLAGNASTVGQSPSLVTVILDSVAPTAASVSGSSSSTTASFSLNFSGAADTLSGLQTVALWSKKSGGSWSATGATSANSSGSFSYTAPSDGTYYFATVATDKSGNSSAAPSGNIGFQVAVAIDLCPSDPLKTAPGLCGCGVVEDTGDSDGDGIINCLDTDGPTVSLNSTASSISNALSIPVTVVFNRSVTGFVAGDLSPTNATISGFTGSGANYSFNLVPTAQGSYSVYLPANKVSDAINGRPNTASAVLSRTFDSIAPTLVLSSATTSATNASPIAVTATFSENVTGFASGDLTLSNATVSGFSGSGKNYSFNLVPVAEGTVSVSVATGKAKDSAQNNNSSSNTLSRTYDTTSPVAPSIGVSVP